MRENKTKQNTPKHTQTNTTPPPPINKSNRNKNQRNTEHSYKWKMIIFSICSWKWFTFKPESENSLKWRSWEKNKPRNVRLILEVWALMLWERWRHLSFCSIHTCVSVFSCSNINLSRTTGITSCWHLWMWE